jgi:hypothetical protein
MFVCLGVRLSALALVTIWLLVPVPDDDDDDDDDERGTGGRMSGRGRQIIQRNPALVPHCPPQIPHELIRSRTRSAAVGSRRITD